MGEDVSHDKSGGAAHRLFSLTEFTTADLFIEARQPHLHKPTSDKMAPSYENLPLEDDDFDESQIDFTDLDDQYQVRLDEGLDAFVVIDGLPVVPEDSKSKLVKFVLRKLNSVGKVKEAGVYMPVNDSGKTEGYVRLLFEESHIRSGNLTEI